MADIEHGSQDHYYPATDSAVVVPIEIQVKSSGEPAEEATRAEALVFKLTPPIDAPVDEIKLAEHDANRLETHPFEKKVGTLTYRLDLGQFVDKAKEHSPILVAFVFEKKFTTGSKKGTTETVVHQRGVFLAEPGVSKVEATPAAARKAGVAVKRKVTEFCAVVYEQAEQPGSKVKGATIPDAAKSEVKWRKSADRGDTWTDLSDTGEEITFTTADEDLEKELLFEAYLGQPAERAEDRATAEVDTRDLYLQFTDELGLPLKNKALTLKLDDGTEMSCTTDDEGCIRPEVDPDRTFEITFEDAHDHAQGEVGAALATASGQHLAAVV
jgi:hypothetical protein